jgi:hypothetical protein
MLTIETKHNNDVHVEIADVDTTDAKSGLPECVLAVLRMKDGTLISGEDSKLNPYEAEAIGNALLRWVKDVTIDVDDDDDDDDDDDEAEDN